MSQRVYEYPCNYVISPHVMFHLSRLYSMASSSKSWPFRGPVWEYFEIVGEKKVRCKLCVPPLLPVHACMCACMRAWMHASVCVCAPIIRYLIIQEATIRIAKITIFSALVVINTNIQTSLVQEMSGSHSEVQHTRTTVVWPWKRLVTMMILLCFA